MESILQTLYDRAEAVAKVVKINEKYNIYYK